MNFLTLKSQIEDTLSRYDDTVVNNIPYFINQAQQRIAREVTLFCLVKTATFAVLADVDFFNPALDYVRSLACRFEIPIEIPNPKYSKQLEYRSKEFLASYYSTNSDPLYYTDWDVLEGTGKILLCPTPHRNLTITFEYYSYPGDLSLTNQENALTRSAPNLLLYGSLLECAPFLKEDERIAVWKQYYDDAKTMYGATNVASKQDRSRDLMKA
jgi:hypothetical protein